LTKSDLGRMTPMVQRHSTLSFKCRSMLSPIAISSPMRISSPLRSMTNASDEKSSTRPLSIDKSPLLSKTPSPLHSAQSSIDSMNNGQRSTAYIPSDRYQPSRVPTAYVPSPHGTHLYSPKHLPKAVVSALSQEVKPPAAAASAYPPQRAPTLPKLAPTIVHRTSSVPRRSSSLSRQRPLLPRHIPIIPQQAPSPPQRDPAPDITPIETSSLYTSRRVSSMFMTPTAEMAPPLMTKFPSPERKLDTFPASPPVHMPLTQPTNLYSTRRAPTPYVPLTQPANIYATRRAPTPYTPYKPAAQQPGPLAPRRLPMAAYTPSSHMREPSSLLAPPPPLRRLRSADRGVSYASNTSSIYSRLTSDEK
jgi:hypothetical protein